MTLAACGDSRGTGPASTVLTERQIHEDATATSFDQTVVLHLEEASGRRPSGDVGTVGTDTYTLQIAAPESVRLRIGERDREALAVEIRDASGAPVAALDGDTPTTELRIEPGEYSVAVERRSAGERPLAVFVHGGTFSRDCPGCALPGIDLGGTDLSAADLRGAKLSSAILAEVDCTRTDFSGADLRGAMLSGASCAGANFTGANLEATAIALADLSGAALTDAQRADTRRLPRRTVGDDGRVASAASAPPPSEFPFTGFVAAFPSVTVAAGQPLVIGPGLQGASVASFESLTLEPGAYVVLAGPTQLTVTGSLTVQGTPPDGGNFRSIAPSGGPGTSGANGLAEGSCDGGLGGLGGPGTDGVSAPMLYLVLGSVTGQVVIQSVSGSGGPGGSGGNGGPAAAGGDGGPGGAGGDGTSVTVLLQGAGSPSIQAITPASAGGPGGAGGAGGPPVSCNGAFVPAGNDGAAGTPGSPGQPSPFNLMQG